jgi:hypothetical protein
MDASLFFAGACIGDVTLGPLDNGRCTGVLTPTDAYLLARPALQRATLGPVTEGVGADQLRDVLRAANAALGELGLELRQPDGSRIATTAIVVGDYMPADLEMDVLRSLMPIHVVALVP